ncbi:hypothetical protein H8356DRAFT_1377915 [Neocallimastix lanati (nom. inval.)]|nr:hypothetical protein H8356DRAFT_1377915 [Neocallimastix sp. JGI-2020a]
MLIHVEHGADINKENWRGETPLSIAFKIGNKDLVKYLVEHGIDINKDNMFKETPLFDIMVGLTLSLQEIVLVLIMSK